MAWLQTDPSGNFHVGFRFGGRMFKRSLKTNNQEEADGRQRRLEENIRLVQSGRLELPQDADVPTFLLSDGKLNGRPKLPQRVGLDGLFEQFFTEIPDGNLEDSTWKCMQIHRRHFVRILGKRISVERLGLGDLQSYVAKRSREKGLRGKNVSGTTIKKEIVTLGTVWKWAAEVGYVKGPFPRSGLRLPKETEKPPFQTWDEIAKQVARGGLSEVEQKELWDCLFLGLDEIDQLLDYVKQAATRPYLYPMFVTAAHTGARRSELLRSRLCDFDDSGTMIIHERKRAKGKRTQRRAPLSKVARQALEDWVSHHPGGSFTFTVDGEPVTRDQANYHFQHTLEGSKWQVIRGWHCLRHSFCSNCALKGIDQRVIDAIVGHTTEAMSRRYRHLFPNSKQAAIDRVFS